MTRFYQVFVQKLLIGSKVQRITPPIQGKVLGEIPDTTSTGDVVLYVVESTDSEHEFNVKYPEVMKLSKEDAIKLATKYQPERTTVLVNRRTGAKEKIKIPAFDLKKVFP